MRAFWRSRAVSAKPGGMTDGLTSSVAAVAADRAWRTAFLVLMLGATAIAFAPIFVRLSEAGPTATAFWRVCLAAPVLWAVLAARRPQRGATRARPDGWGDVARLSLAGFFFAGDLIFWHWSMQFTSVANATLLANFAPIFVTLGAWALFKERVTRTFLLGGGLALAGATLLMADSLTVGVDTLFGDGLGLVTAVFYGGYILTIGWLRGRFDTITIMAWSTTATAVIVLPVAALSGEAFLPGTLAGWLVLVGLACVSHVGGQGMIAYALAHLPAAFSSVSLLVQPVLAAVFAWVLLAEPLGPLQALGGAIVLGGIALARRGAARRPLPARRLPPS
jgi:drug/metabolite transporter (DMT)-like permease